MNHQTPYQVDPIELRKKLRRLGIGAKFQLSQAAAMDAVNEARKKVPNTGFGAMGAGVTLPERLEPEELAYMVNAWSLLWEVPA